MTARVVAYRLGIVTLCAALVLFGMTLRPAPARAVVPAIIGGAAAAEWLVGAAAGYAGYSSLKAACDANGIPYDTGALLQAQGQFALDPTGAATAGNLDFRVMQALWAWVKKMGLEAKYTAAAAAAKINGDVAEVPVSSLYDNFGAVGSSDAFEMATRWASEGTKNIAATTYARVSSYDQDGNPYNLSPRSASYDPLDSASENTNWGTGLAGDLQTLTPELTSANFSISSGTGFTMGQAVIVAQALAASFYTQDSPVCVSPVALDVSGSANTTAYIRLTNAKVFLNYTGTGSMYDYYSAGYLTGELIYNAGAAAWSGTLTLSNAGTTATHLPAGLNRWCPGWDAGAFGSVAPPTKLEMPTVNTPRVVALPKTIVTGTPAQKATTAAAVTAAAPMAVTAPVYPDDPGTPLPGIQNATLAAAIAALDTGRTSLDGWLKRLPDLPLGFAPLTYGVVAPALLGLYGILSVMKWMLGFFDAMAQTLASWWKWALATAKPIWAEIAAGVSLAWTGFTTAMNAWWEPVKTWWQERWDALMAALGLATVTTLPAWADGVYTDVTNPIFDSWDEIVNENILWPFKALSDSANIDSSGFSTGGGRGGGGTGGGAQ